LPEAPTIYEVARHAGVSIATVSRALRRPDDLREETRERVLRAVAELGYVPSGPAHGLATGRTWVLGLARADLHDPEVEEGHETLLFADEVLRGMEWAARQAGYAVLLATADQLWRGFDLELAGKTDGMVVLARSVSAEALERLARRVPVVVAAGPDVPEGIDHVSVANAEGTTAVTAHLLEDHGAEQLAFLGGPPDSPDGASRFNGYRAALAVAGRPAPGRPDLTADFTEGGGRAAMRAYLAGGRRPGAVVCANDQMAVGALTALAEAGLEVPHDVLVTGFDDIQLARHVSPPLTTVQQPMRQLGATAAELLLRRIDDPLVPPRAMVLNTRLVVRQSCGCQGVAVGRLIPAG
jgi:LacI family transcriptional regulator